MIVPTAILVLLETRCGCMRMMEIDVAVGLKELPQSINVPLIPVMPLSGRQWNRVFTAVGTKKGMPHYREMSMSPVWTREEMENNNGPADIW